MVAGQQQEVNDVRLPCARRPLRHAVIEREIETVDFVVREKARELHAGVPLDAACGIRLNVAAEYRMVENSVERVQRAIGRA